MLSWCRHLIEADLSDLHPWIYSYWQVRHVGEFQGDLALEPRVDEARSRVNQETESTEARLAFETCNDVIGETNNLKRRPENELARVEDEWLVIACFHTHGEVTLRGFRVDDGVSVVLENPEMGVATQVDTRWLHHRLVIRIDRDPAARDRFLDGSV